MKLFYAILLAALSMPAHAAMYKWVDAQGRVQYTDTPPPPNAKKVEEQKIIRNTIQTTGTPFAVQDAAKRNPVTVWISDCGDLCNRARDFLAKRGIPHSVRNPSQQSEQEAWKRASGGDNSVPLLIVGGLKTIKGYDENEWHAALDSAGYPRNAPSLKPQAIPADPKTAPQAAAPIAEKK
jgi:glutaredoxin